MKKVTTSVLAFALMALLAPLAHAYNSPVGSDPKNGSYDVEYKYVVKSAVAGESGAVSKGDILTWASAYDGYSVTKMGGGASVAQQRAVACIAAEAIASGDVGYHRCVTRGYVDYLKFDATIAFNLLDSVCVNAQAAAEGCTNAKVAVGVDGLSGTATAALGKIVSLQTKASGTGTSLKAIINIP